jgi:CRISPR-associated endonuclease/helicase Cas3
VRLAEVVITACQSDGLALLSAWPMSFGLLNAGVQFVFDEVQLMGPGLATSLQLQGMREAMGTALPCRSMWMSATLDPAELSTVDFWRRELSLVELDEDDRSGPLRIRIEATRTVRRLELGDVDTRHYPKALAARVAAEHRHGTRTLVVLNTVQRATEVFDELSKVGLKARLVLLHSRFRPGDRRRYTQRLREALGEAGSVVVATQVLEAGVDLTSETLITEVAPWSSIVQRAGRCNRDGLAHNARLLWITPPAPPPYDSAELSHTADVLAALEGQAVTSEELAGRTNGVSPQPDEPCPGRLPVLGQAHAGTRGQSDRPPPLATPRYVDHDAKCVCAGQVRCVCAVERAPLRLRPTDLTHEHQT